MKKVFVILFGVMIFYISTCSAMIPRNKAVLGGLGLGQPISYATKIYGAPNKISELPYKESWEWKNNKIFKSEEVSVANYYWGDGSFSVTESIDGRINQIFISKNNGIATADGVIVGMNKNVLLKVYGNADWTFHPEGLDFENRDYRDYCYNCHSSRGHYGDLLVFGVENDRIVNIRLFIDAHDFEILWRGHS